MEVSWLSVPALLRQYLWKMMHGKENMAAFAAEFQELHSNLYDRLAPHWVQLPGHGTELLWLPDDSFCAATLSAEQR